MEIENTKNDENEEKHKSIEFFNTNYHFSIKNVTHLQKVK